MSACRRGLSILAAQASARRRRRISRRLNDRTIVALARLDLCCRSFRTFATLIQQVDRAAGRASRPNVATPVASTGRPTAMSLMVTASLYLRHLLTATRERHDRYLYLRRLLQPRRLRCRKRKLDRLL